jgi:hypothetical protein
MMHKSELRTFKEYSDIINNLALNDGIILYRGQSTNYPLLPSVVRDNPSFDSTKIEQSMLSELQRQTQLKVATKLKNNAWDWLVYAQHFGMKTRLLDWTSNPLTALWFACSNEYKMKEDSYVYIFIADKDYLVDKTKSPFTIPQTRILRPSLNNERIIAQGGWFTAHKYSKTKKCFVPIEKNNMLNDKIIQVKVPFKLKPEILKRLNVFGINSQALFPDITGVCTYLNWLYKDKFK